MSLALALSLSGATPPMALRASLELDFLKQAFSMNRQSKNFADIITFSRPSAATRVNPLGLIETVAANVPCIDHSPVNLATGTGAQTLALAKDRTYAITAVGGTVAVAGAGVNVSQMGAASGVIQTPAGSGTVDVTFTPGGSVTALHVREVLGLSVWEQRTNLLLKSNDFSFVVGFWNNCPGNISVVLDALQQSGLSLQAVARTSNASSYIGGPTLAATAGTTFTASIYAKAKSTGNYYALRIIGGYPRRVDAVINLLTGAIAYSGNTNFTGLTAASIPMGNGLYRLIVSGVCQTSENINVQHGPLDASIISGAWEGSSAVMSDAYVGACQLEVGAFASPYIPTTTSQVTRAADGPPSETLTPWFKPEKGTVIWTGDVSATPAGIWPGLFQFDDASVANRFGCYVDANRYVTFAKRLSYAPVEVMTTNQFVAGQRFKVAVSWDATNMYISLNGGPVSTVAHGGLPAVSRLVHGKYDNMINGREAGFKYLPKSTVGTALQALSV
ncbi:hypothetical protein GBK02_09215 [Dechloromonas sp. TW-R-39-2]|uniref:phage head spike fiber domain-containing protein n=1 Tax=Dechloromonas sp. TW-R-39-2 TaxID=2654218 RepID=UPI00193D0D4A|nr:hypothetical protein [Dechloromonas sp. TW-R-39-2]QRM19568.1 hypothetical protein GBK02_09215 [Dechloromonas sp. TW-R-39-2]